MFSNRQFRVAEVTNQRLRSSRDQLALADLCIKSSHHLIMNSGTALDIADHVKDSKFIVSDTEHWDERAPNVSQQREFLDSWKAIAVFLERGVRTVQRWEREEGLPVHRHRHSRGGTVFAFASEIQKWRNSRSASARFESSERPQLSISSLPTSVAGDLTGRCEAARLRAEKARGVFQPAYNNFRSMQRALRSLRHAS